MYRKITVTLIIAGFCSTATAQTLLECSRIEDSAERIACYDKVAGRVEEKMEETFEGTTEQRIEARQESIADEVVGPDEPVPELLPVDIKRVHRTRSNRFVYETADGRLFQKSSSSRVMFRVGDRCTLEPGLLGSLFLVRDDGKKIKVEELNSK